MEAKPVLFEADVFVFQDRLDSLRSLEQRLKSENELMVRVVNMPPSEVWSLRVSAEKPLDRATLFGLARALGFADDEWKFGNEENQTLRCCRFDGQPDI